MDDCTGICNDGAENGLPYRKGEKGCLLSLGWLRRAIAELRDRVDEKK